MRLALLALMFWLLVGCAGRSAQPDFAERDLYTMLAVDATNRGDFIAAANYQGILHQNTRDDRFFYEQIDSLLRAGRYDEVIALTSARLTKGEEKITRRYKAYAYAGKQQHDTAIEVAKKLITYDRQAEDYLLLGDLMLQGRDDPRRALEYYKGAYALDPAERTVDAIATLLINTQNAHQEAFAYYESHILQYGCSEFLCQKVANFYAGRGNITGVIRAYRRIYEAREDEIVGQKLVELYLLQEDFETLALWLEKSRFNDEVLLEVYRHREQYAKAARVADRLYAAGGEIEYLALSAMLAYESGDSKDMDLVRESIEKLTIVVESGEREPVYLNYLGYLLIDYDLDTPRGVELVKEALLDDPDNPAYLDSLAWGYYRLSRFDEAYATITKAYRLMPADPIVRDHYHTIKRAAGR